MPDPTVKTITNKVEFYVKGMHCPACELFIEKKARKHQDLSQVNAILKKQKLQFIAPVDFDREQFFIDFNQELKDSGYSLVEEAITKKVAKKQLLLGFIIASIIITSFIIFQKLGIANFLNVKTLSLPVIFAIGIIASLSTCMAVVGGLILSISAEYASAKQKIGPLVGFHLSRLISFFILGGVFGLIGGVITFSSTFYLIMGFLVFVIMFILGMNLLDIFPFFRRFQISMPKSLANKALNSKFLTKTNNFILPIFAGAITFFLPCGFTQSMQFEAINAGSFINGALIMFVFALGTLPVFSLISFTSLKLGDSKKAQIFFKAAGFLVIFFAIFNLLATLASEGIIPSLF